MRATVLGAGGFIGRHLARHLEGRGYEVIRWVRGQPLPSDLGTAFYAVGMTKNFAERSEATVEAHAGLLSRALTHRWDDFVFLSSTRLYDGCEVGREDGAVPISVDRPRHLFDASKLLGEICTLQAGGRVARLANVYSDSLDAEVFLHDAVRAAVEGRAEPICRHLDAARDYVHVDDVCRALVTMTERGGDSLVNVACGVNVPNQDLFDLLHGHTGHRLQAEHARGAHTAPVVNIGRLRALEVQPRRLEETLPDLLLGAGWNGLRPDVRRVA